MFTQIGTRARSLQRSKALRLLLLVALLATGIPFGGAWTTPTPKAQPILLAMAAQQPEATVAVVVQKTAQGANPEALVARLGGQVVNHLPIINAFAAELPAEAVPALASTRGVRWVSLDAPVFEAGKPGPNTGPTPTPTPCTVCIDTSKLKNEYIRAIRADQVWNTAPYLQGQGIGVAVVDSGIGNHLDFQNGAGVSRVIAQAKFDSRTDTMADKYGHGTHVSGIIGGNGQASGGQYIGVAPKVNLINVKISDDSGASNMSDVINALQWVLDNRTTYNIRVVNLSLNSSVAEAYHTSPLSAAVEILWFNGIVVVVSAGNNGTATLYPPANDPFVITVGATNDMMSTSVSDDTLASFSAYGTTESGFAKPDLVAPGFKIKSVLAPDSALAKTDPGYVETTTSGVQYFKMSGTSMAAPMVSGAVALLLQDEPALTPDQVKYRLMATTIKGRKQFPAYNATTMGAGLLDVYAAVNGTTTASANTGVQASQLLWSGSEPVTWSSVSWNSV
ncbi:MAG TPA: S8 family peptidase, partial [Ardenticatenaceae bacterium]|nr:S8 family peptidase [Ardenticatenaceae bacterium]